MARKTTKQIKRRLVITVPVTLVIMIFSLYTAIIEFNKVKSYKTENKKLVEQLENLKKEAESLNIEITKLSSPDYIARYAREKYLYSKDGEKVVIVDVIKKEQKVEENDETLDSLKYMTIGTGIILVIVVIGIIYGAYTKFCMKKWE